MADTARTKSALATLLADNTSGDISPQDIRDFLESMDLPFGSLYVSTPGNTTILTQSTPTKIGQATTLGTCNAVDDDSSTSNRLRYTGALTRNFLVFVTASVATTYMGNIIVNLSIAKGGSNIASTESQTIGRDDGFGIVNNVTSFGVVSLAQNEYVEAFVSNESGTDNVAVGSMSMMVVGLFQ